MTRIVTEDSTDKPREACGVIGIYTPAADAARQLYFGLHALQHRGQEAAGIAASDGQHLHKHKGMGLVAQVFKEEDFAHLPGQLAIGHTRYSTSGASVWENAQPFVIDTQHGALAMAHNGNIANAAVLRAALLQRGFGLSVSSDTAVMMMELAGASGKTWEERLQASMPDWQGAYCLVLLTANQVLAVRDPWGFRPLSVGELPDGGYAVASETGALQTLGCTTISEVLPGEIITLDAQGLQRCQGMPPAKPVARCTFEHIYFSRPDSRWDNLSVHQVRQRLGEILWEEMQTAADVVVPVPDSAIPAAIGFSRASGIAYNDGFIKNRYIGRTFIQPTENLREQGVALKFNALPENLRDKRVIMIDDSIVRGNTSGPLIQLLRDAGAREVHVGITCPPIQHPCFMGIDMGTYDELIAHRLALPEIAQKLGCDSLHYLSLAGMMRALQRDTGYCNACFTGIYPFPIHCPSKKTDSRV